MKVIVNLLFFCGYCSTSDAILLDELFEEGTCTTLILCESGIYD